MKGIAFIKDPDGYWIEILNNNTVADMWRKPHSPCVAWITVVDCVLKRQISNGGILQMVVK